MVVGWVFPETAPAPRAALPPGNWFRRRGCVTSVPLLWGGGHHCSRQWGPVSERGERLGCCEGLSLVLVPVKALAYSLQFSLRCGLLPLSPNSPFVPHPSVLLPPLLTLSHLWTFSYACPRPSFDPHRSFSSPAPDGVSVPSFSWHTVAAHLELQSSLRKKPFPPSEKRKSDKITYFSFSQSQKLELGYALKERCSLKRPGLVVMRFWGGDPLSFCWERYAVPWANLHPCPWSPSDWEARERWGIGL